MKKTELCCGTGHGGALALIVAPASGHKKAYDTSLQLKVDGLTVTTTQYSGSVRSEKGACERNRTITITTLGVAIATVVSDAAGNYSVVVTGPPPAKNQDVIASTPKKFIKRNSKHMVAGATGYIGSLLCRRLAEEGAAPRALARHPDRGRGPRHGRLRGRRGRRAALPRPWRSRWRVSTLLLLPGSLDGARGRGRLRRARPPGGRELRRCGGQARASSGSSIWAASPIEGSRHLESRHATAGLSGLDRAFQSPTCAPRPLSVRGVSRFAPCYYLVKRLPLMVTPRWVATRTQPIAIARCDRVSLPG